MDNMCGLVLFKEFLSRDWVPRGRHGLLVHIASRYHENSLEIALT